MKLMYVYWVLKVMQGEDCCLVVVVRARNENYWDLKMLLQKWAKTCSTALCMVYQVCMCEITFL